MKDEINWSDMATTGNSTTSQPLDIKKLREIMASVGPSIMSHPNTLKLLEKEMQVPRVEDNPFRLRVYVDHRIPEFGPVPTGKWLWHEGGYFPPNDKFVEYEASDLPWLEKLGMVRREYTRGRSMFLMSCV